MVLLISQLDHSHHRLLLNRSQSHGLVGSLRDRHPTAEVLMSAAVPAFSRWHAIASSFHTLRASPVFRTLAANRAARPPVSTNQTVGPTNATTTRVVLVEVLSCATVLTFLRRSIKIIEH